MVVLGTVSVMPPLVTASVAVDILEFLAEEAWLRYQLILARETFLERRRSCKVVAVESFEALFPSSGTVL